MKPCVHLWDAVGLGLIIEWPSGVLYSNQTGGTACLHPTVEGFYVPLSNDRLDENDRLLSPETELLTWFQGSKHAGAGATSGLDVEDAVFITQLLDRWRLGAAVQIDMPRLAESHEAWVHVIVRPRQDQLGPLPMRGFDDEARSGILTWCNSD